MTIANRAAFFPLRHPETDRKGLGKPRIHRGDLWLDLKDHRLLEQLRPVHARQDQHAERTTEPAGA